MSTDIPINAYLRDWAKAIYARDRKLITAMQAEPLREWISRILAPLMAQEWEISVVTVEVLQLLRDNAAPANSPKRGNPLYR